MNKTLIFGAALSAAFLFGNIAMAQDAPRVNIGERHGNLRNAQENIVAAYDYVSNAQAANEDQLGGHAARAKELLREADHELRMAANVANSHE